MSVVVCQKCGSKNNIEKKNDVHTAGAWCGDCGGFIKWLGNGKNMNKRKDKNAKWRKQWHDINPIYKCAVCGITEKELRWQWQCDHIIPLNDGGLDEFENTQMLCTFCHNYKHIQRDFVKAVLKGVGINA